MIPDKPQLSPPAALSADSLGLTPAQRLSEQLRELHLLISATMFSSLQGQMQHEAFSFSQVMALHCLRAQAPLSVSALAEQLQVSLPAASQLVQGLVERGLVARRENPSNRREKLLELSQAGQTSLEQKDCFFTAAYAKALESVDPATLQQASDALNAVLLHAQATPLSTPITSSPPLPEHP